MTITLHIERVVLDGVPLEHPRTLQNAIERELTNRLREGGLSPEFRAGGAAPWVGGGAIELGREQNAVRLGTRIAGAVYRGIGGRR